MRQSQVDKLYAGLKDLSEERRGKLDERFRLFQLNREVDDLEQWIAERELVAGSHELGQDYEHVTVSKTHAFHHCQQIRLDGTHFTAHVSLVLSCVSLDAAGAFQRIRP